MRSVTLGFVSLLVSAWVDKISATVRTPLDRVWPVLVFLALVAAGWIGGRALFRVAESNFWSMNSVAVEPAYIACRELLRHIVEGVLRGRRTQSQLAKLRAVTACGGRRRVMRSGDFGARAGLAHLALGD